MQQILDSVIALDEIDMLRFRVEYLSKSGYVGEFHIFEGSHTFQGQKREPKLHTVSQELSTFAPIFHHYLNFPRAVLNSRDPWKLETWLRNQQLSYLKQSGKPILFGDVDEIPSNAQIKEAVLRISQGTCELVSLPLKGAYVSASLEFFYAEKLSSFSLVHRKHGGRYVAEHVWKVINSHESDPRTSLELLEILKR